MKPIFLMLLPSFWFIYLHLLLFFTFNSSWFGLNTNVSALGNDTDHLALLKFKESISNNPLDSWNSSTHFCNWPGITCNFMHQRVVMLKLQGYELHGSISPAVGNLSFLRILDLHSNSFVGKIPQEVGRLVQLQSLHLSNNSLTGEIPTNLTGCSKLERIDLSSNNLIGKLPNEIGSLGMLREFVIVQNKIEGQIPPSIGNLSSLSYLVLGDNQLEGHIPQEIGHLRNLVFLDLYSNKLSGILPSTLYNMSSLITFSASVNQFNGSLPSNIFHTLPNLQEFDIGGNHVSGPIPTSMTNASVLRVFDIAGSHFVGRFPNVGKLCDLRMVSASQNLLGSNSSKDLEFLSPLTNCSKLRVLSISYNNFGGVLPNFIGNFSTQLSQLYLGGNEISGKIPSELGNLNSLILLTMESNHFNGIIPSTFGKFQKMQKLELGGNKLSGEISPFIGNLSELFFLYLGDNMLEGSIPPTLINCQKLQYLNLSQNNLNGTIPSEVFSLFSLTALDLSQNLLSGNLPGEVGRLKNIEVLDMSKNHLSGEILGTIGECMSLEYLYLQGNSFHGIISSSLASLKGLRALDLSQNHFSGSIPEGLQDISTLEYLNVSFNMLDGEVPTEGIFRNASRFAMSGNRKLCAGISELHLPPCPVKDRKLVKHHNHTRLIVVIACVVAFLLIMLSCIIIYWMKKGNKQPFSDSSAINQLPMVSYKSLHNGTDGFSARNLIGFGNFGSVYKGTLESEDKVVAIKVLNLQKKGAHKSFLAECNALRNIRHRNLVKILTCCSSIDYKGQEFKALVSEFMTNGSIESWLHPAIEIADQPKALDLVQRLNIITDVASVLHYLHYECEQAIIHCDLKPSNILLDDCFVAHLTDFGLAKLLSSIGVSPKQTSTVEIKGTIGYAAPEYGMGSQVSIEGDMYSFGILVLEMLTGRRPTDEIFKDGQNLHDYVRISIPNHLSQIVDPTILPEEFEGADYSDKLTPIDPNVRECLHSLFRIALACSMESSKERMSMVSVIRELNLIKSSLLRTMEGDCITNTTENIEVALIGC
ncbi:putative protein kinase RLK-Pelle-LRR-XII-1 family [Lupinus albus]|uniref:non-specific serine/threonine protein kinase n=1 Tax=Lupinus albus TaxID=3870 RepID=A0A6A4NMH4_LUPAL|nr:putative protein kinase RLK-Pelle-LRR-XII-1 family [Lupinus albus]